MRLRTDMLTAHHYLNPNNDRRYVLEYGKDLLGNHVVKIRYGINLGISKVYVFGSISEQIKKIDEIKLKRQRSGYYLG